MLRKTGPERHDRLSLQDAKFGVPKFGNIKRRSGGNRMLPIPFFRDSSIWIHLKYTSSQSRHLASIKQPAATA